MFNIKNPADYICHILGYIKGHSLMVVGIHSIEFPQEKAYLVFQAVQYFEGPMTWKGIDMQLGEANECLELLHKLEKYEGISNDILAKSFKLFIISSSGINMIIKVLAASASLSSDNPLSSSSEAYEFTT